MALEVLSGPAGDLLKKVCSLAAEEIVQVWGVKGDLKKLQHTLESIQDVLYDAEMRQVEDKAVRHWLGRLKGVAYDADDVLDEFQTEILRRKIEIHNSIKGKVCNFFSLSNPIAFHFKMAHKIKDINLALEEIRKEKDILKLSGSSSSTNAIILENKVDRETQPHIGNLKIFGRENDKSEIIKVLINSSSNQPTPTALSVLAIVGMGGLGKTTLAKLVFNDESIKRHFEERIWVCVSDVFDVKTILKNILEYLGDKSCNETSCKATLVKALQEKINEKRYLLVLDDVWNTDSQKWQDLESSLIGSNNAIRNNGSCIIITTRNTEVASITGPAFTCNLHPLDDEDECWSIFESLAFGFGGPQKKPNLEAIGQEIVRKCGGVPLVLNFMGTLMRSKKEVDDWLLIQNNLVWNLPEGDDKIRKVLKLSYDHLSPPLKQCFSYCSIFPKDFEMSNRVLIQMWMAQGFLNADPNNRSGGEILMEDIGNIYFNTLKQNSFFQDIKEDLWDENLWDRITTCKMHDFVHDLALYVSGSEYYRHKNVTDRSHENYEVSSLSSSKSAFRHLSVESYADNIPEDLWHQKLRTFVLLEYSWNAVKEKNWTAKMLMKARCLRVLDLSRTEIEELPNSIGKLIHLRYLDISKTEIEMLPQSITKLRNLQTLKIQECYKLKKLPMDMGKLISLRHLEADYFRKFEVDDFREMEDDDFREFQTRGGIGSLRNLQTMPYFRVWTNQASGGGGISELKELNNLRGLIRIGKLENVRDEEEAKEACLQEKKYIERLELDWSVGVSSSSSASVLEGLQPHSNLQQLSVYGFPGDKFPSWMMLNIESSLPNLVVVKLGPCEKCKDLPPLGTLPI